MSESKYKKYRGVPYGPKWMKDANRLARDYAPDIYPCPQCGSPRASGYCCPFCGSGECST